MKPAESTSALKLLPSTDELLLTSTAKRLLPEVGLRRLTSLARAAIEESRRDLLESSSLSAPTKESLLTDAAARLNDLWASRRSSRLRKVINATGVVIHTNLGRAPLSSEALDAIRDASGYSTLEYSIETGRRGKRGGNVETMLMELTGAEAAIVVNNCAAAAFLVLTVFAKGGEAIVSRGELVEIGGDFRIPDVLTQSGATLIEVGTTNRTKLADYERAIGENTRVVMRVHPSNYRIVGFTAKPSLAELADLCNRKGVLLYEDAGSGAMIDVSDFGLSDEPEISRSIGDGADVVTFSGDKLLGATQAGLIVGRRGRIEQIRKHPLYRALRVDKLTYAALEATLDAYLSENVRETVPVMKMLSVTKEEAAERAQEFARALEERVGKGSVELIDGESVVGGGSAPGERLDTKLIALQQSTVAPEEIERKLRESEPPVIARIENESVLIDLRTVDPSDESKLLELVATALV